MPGHELTIGEALQGASALFKRAHLENPLREAQYLFSQVLGWDRLKLFLESGTPLSPQKAARLQEAARRRARGEPLAYITGRREFYGLEFAVTPAVLIPRPESEFLIEAAREWADRAGRGQGEGVRAVDLGTGSGNLAVTLAVLWPAAQLWAVDISGRALAVAAHNASRHRVQDRLRLYQGHYFSALPAPAAPLKFNVIISNPPYIPQKELANLPGTVKDFEPVVALDGGADGLAGYREILAGLPPHLLTPGLVAVEIGAGQHRGVSDLFKDSGLFQRVEVRTDYGGHSRVVTGFA